MSNNTSVLSDAHGLSYDMFSESNNSFVPISYRITCVQKQGHEHEQEQEGNSLTTKRVLGI